jgi:hypothetical protein
MGQKPIQKHPAVITDRQVTDAELLIVTYFPEAKLRSEFREELKDALTLTRYCYDSVLGPTVRSQSVRRRDLMTLRRAMTVIASSLEKEGIKQQVADFLPLFSASPSDSADDYENWSAWQSKRKDILDKIDHLNATLRDVGAMIDRGLATPKPTSDQAVPRQKTKAITIAAGVFLGQLGGFDLPTGLGTAAKRQAQRLRSLSESWKF